MKRDFLANKALNLKLKNEVINTLPQYLSEALALKVDYVGYREFGNASILQISILKGNTFNKCADNFIMDIS